MTDGVFGYAAPRAEKDLPAVEGNPVSRVSHLGDSAGGCLGVRVMLWCPGCQELHTPRFRCPEHGGPQEGPVWDGDPEAVPLTIVGSYLVYEAPPRPRCHSFIRRGRWEFLEDCTHGLRGTIVPLEPLPDWVVG